ncbi:hypothetical protein BKP54_00530 [Ensifer sp. 1H6]|nr:hypothetical protein BKP54_00530 [Ensifer sp. 1H6]
MNHRHCMSARFLASAAVASVSAPIVFFSAANDRLLAALAIFERFASRALSEAQASILRGDVFMSTWPRRKVAAAAATFFFGYAEPTYPGR